MKAEREIGFGPTRHDDVAGLSGDNRGRQAPPRRGEKESRTLLRRRRLYQMRRLLRAAGLVLMVGGGIFAYRSGLAQDMITGIGDRLTMAAIDAGFVVERIDVRGAANIPVQDLHGALGVSVGDPVFGFNIDDARNRVSALGWVQSVSVARELPDGVTVDIVERVPFAVWQNDGVFRLVDRAGFVITDRRMERFAKLPLVVGDGAAEAAADLVATLATEPALNDAVRAAVRVGGRRWDIIFENGMRARLPESGESRAWNRLARLVRSHALLDRAVHVVDLRVEDRLYMRLTKDAAQERRERMEAKNHEGAV